VTLVEPNATAAILLVVGALLAFAALFSRASARLGLPVFLTFIAIGMLAGSEGIGGIAFENYPLAFRFGTVALALILFDGGLSTSMATIRRAVAPAGVLATFGVLATAAVVALAAGWFGQPWGLALLLGAVVSSTDAATVFAVLRAGGVRLRPRLAATLELESGLNDPVAVLLTAAITGVLAHTAQPSWSLLLAVPLQLVVGALAGAAVGWLGRRVLLRAHLPAAGLYAVISLAVACVGFGLPTLLLGSGFLGVYTAGVVLGGARLPFRSSLLRIHDALAWLAQVTMFLMLGLLVFPSRLLTAAPLGIALGLVLALVARPLATLVSLAPFRFPPREVAAASFIGLRGAVPIILATLPVMAAVPDAEGLFDVVFFIVVTSAIVPGAMVPAVARRLAVLSNAPPPPQAVLEIHSLGALSGDVLSYLIQPAAAACGAAIRDLPFPEGSVAMLLVRGDNLLAPRGNTVLEPGDHLYVYATPTDQDLLDLLLGGREEGAD
jgi:cell volume regulation protein A